MKATGGIVKLDDLHIIGDSYCSPCLPFPDPDYTIDAGLMNPNIILPPINCDFLTEDQIKELEEEIRKSLKLSVKMRKSIY